MQRNYSLNDMERKANKSLAKVPSKKSIASSSFSIKPKSKSSVQVAQELENSPATPSAEQQKSNIKEYKKSRSSKEAEFEFYNKEWKEQRENQAIAEKKYKEKKSSGLKKFIFNLTTLHLKK